MNIMHVVVVIDFVHFKNNNTKDIIFVTVNKRMNYIISSVSNSIFKLG